jgi:2,3-bisphosphoglycerate-independent phosphoglycerate mutase
MCSDSSKKYLIVVPDGMADAFDPPESCSTPLKSANTPWMDKMALAGKIGVTRTVPDGMDPASDVANLSILGYSPSEVYTGRAPFEAASMGVELGPDDLAFRLNLVTLERNFTIMADHSADHISSPEARELIGAVEQIVEDLGMTVVPGVSYRNLLVWNGGPEGIVTHAPHDFPGEPVASMLPSGLGSDMLLRLIVYSWKVLENHPVNLRRVNRCQGPANSVWPWGQGKPPRMKTLTERFGITGSVVAAVDLIKGLGKYAGLNIVDVPGATGYLDTNYQGKVDAAVNALKTQDFVYLHVEAPDEAGHSGQMDLKIKAIEDFDARVLSPLFSGLAQFPDWRILLMPDHQTPVAGRVHTNGPVPFILLDSSDWNKHPDNASITFSEEAAHASGHSVEDASNLLEILLKKS